MRPDDPELLRLLRRIYRGVWGYDVGPADAARVERSGGAETYGEIRPAAAARLLAHLRLGPSDVLYDLGSGTGRFALHAALGTRVGRVVGVELARARHEAAVAARAAARAAGRRRADRLELRCADLLRVSLADATVVYCCDTAFPEPFLARLARKVARARPGLRFVSTAPLDPSPRLALEEVLRLDMSWRRRSKTYLYRVAAGGRSR